MTEHTIPGQLSEADTLAYIRLLQTEMLGPVPIRIDHLVELAEPPPSERASGFAGTRTCRSIDL